MPSTTRRALLCGAGAAAVGALAGCSASETHSSSPDGGTLVTDYTAVITRSAGERAPVVAPREDTGGATTTTEPFTLHAFESESDAEALALADDASNAAAVRRLVAETDYASESVLAYQTRIGECYRLAVQYVARDADGSPNVECCRVVRDAHTACERRERDHAAAFVRVPFTGEEYSGLSVGSGGDCGRVPERYRNGSESA
ncbi:hypothetical protein EFA46_011725 (plasmid) [Halarchaeum sp. CBA1220]|uniref:hypothetical protein n=1 Tax=Halarchaeum sp. CBA1220 TaxID=1853682 RepID=UPI000F3AA78E|nr:hypothetical protein [Halarchaeum sp. CBA1220]QLC34923.1 hypothetical protein EFA46_011725 [Halarchaeum sp. CBA1220]